MIELASAAMNLLRPLASSLVISVCLAACGDSGDASTTSSASASTGDGDTTADTSTGAPTSGEESSGDAPTSSEGGEETGSSSTGEPDPLLEGSPEPNSEPDQQEVDVLGSLGVHYWFAVDPEEVERMNEVAQQEPDIYTPGDGAETYADHMFVSTPGESPTIADYGKVEVRVVGQSTYRPWTKKTIPSLKVDTDEFTDKLKVGGVEHLRFNNSLVGTIFRERLAFATYEALDYPAPRATYAWVGSNVWGPEIEVPYTLVEVYKRDFCEARSEQLGGGCYNIWEFVGDLGNNMFADSKNCQLSSCDNKRAIEFETKVMATPPGAGYKAALKEYVDWPAFHRFQCISWLLWTGDDTLHNNNNVVLLERKDGRFQYLPYSVDISAGQSWYQNTPLYGNNQLALGCQADPKCWKDTISECEDVVAEFVASEPAKRVDEVYAALEGEGMLRDGDEGRYMEVRSWYENRAATALADLDNFREAPCSPEMVKCGKECVQVQECVLECEAGSVQCGTQCVPEGECFSCDWPFEMCPDLSCRPQGMCK